MKNKTNNMEIHFRNQETKNENNEQPKLIKRNPNESHLKWSMLM